METGVDLATEEIGTNNERTLHAKGREGLGP